MRGHCRYCHKKLWSGNTSGVCKYHAIQPPPKKRTRLCNRIYKYMIENRIPMTTAQLKDNAGIIQSSDSISQQMTRDDRFVILKRIKNGDKIVWGLPNWIKECERSGCERWTERHSKNQIRRFCGKRCNFLNTSQNPKMKTISCHGCGDPITGKKWRIEQRLRMRNNEIYCDIQCVGTSRILDKTNEILEHVRNGVPLKKIAEMYDMKVSAVYGTCTRNGGVQAIRGY